VDASVVAASHFVNRNFSVG